MRIRSAAVLLFLLAALSPLFSQAPGIGKLEITFTDIRNDKGQIAIGINDSEEGWPRTPLIERQWPKSTLKDGKLTVVVDKLKFGDYAVSVLDDENMNQEMDSRLGIPREGYGFSNNPKVKMSAPKYENCKFRIDGPVKKITIQVRYF